MKIKLMGLAALALASLLVVPVSAQEKTAAKKIMLKEKHEVGIVVTEKSVETRDGKIKIAAGGNEMDGADLERGESESTTEILAVNAAGDISDGRVAHTKDRKKKSSQKPGEPEMGPEEESTGDMEGVTIRYTWSDETKGFAAKLEAGENAKDTKDVLKALKKKQPFKAPFLTGKEVAVGETWEVAEAALREFIGEDDEGKITEVKATCKFEEIISDKTGEFAKVSFVMTLKGTFNDDNLGELEVSGKNEGHFLLNIAQGRITKVEMKSEMGFEKEVQSPQGNVKVTYKMTGSETKDFTFAKKEGK